MTLKTQKSLEDIYLLLKQSPYKESRQSGFVGISISKDNRISATYTECKKTYTEVHDPFGNITEQEFVAYTYLDFSIEHLKDGLLLLSVYAPPQSLKSLTSKLGEILNYAVAISSLKLEINSFLSIFKNKYHATSIQVEKLKISGLVLNKSSKANIEITSSSDASNEIANFTQNRHHTLDKVRAIALHSGEAIKFELSKTGSITLQEDYNPLFTKIIKDYISENT
jgi:hypothetical protein